MRWSTALAVSAGLVSLLLRALGIDAWRLVLAIALALLGVRLVGLVVDVVRGALPWTRLLLPSIVWIEAAGASGSALWQLRLATAIALELLFVVVAIHALRRRDTDGPIEERLARALESLVPPPIARLAAIELVLVGFAMSFLAGGWRRPTPAGFTSHRESGLRTMLPLLPLLAAGDVLLLELVILPRASTSLRIAVHALAAYGLVWLVGVYASIRARPHRLVNGRLELHRGIFRTMTLDVDQIVSIEPLPPFADDWKKRAYLRGAERLDLGGAPVLEIELRDHTRALVAVDDPAAFSAASLPAAPDAGASLHSHPRSYRSSAPPDRSRT